MKIAGLRVGGRSWQAPPTQAVHTTAGVKSFGSFLSLAFIGWLPLVVLPSVAAVSYRFSRPWVFMWTLAISIYLGLKWVTWWAAKKPIPHSLWRSAAYLLAWPGMDAESFLDKTKRHPMPRFREWLWASSESALGVILLWFLARMFPQEHPLLRGWTGMMGLILLLHFGSFQIAALLWQCLGVDASPIMSAPLRSKSLSEFWGKRWNLGFRQLAHDLIFVPVHKYLHVGSATILVFLVSGLIHDLVISVPAHAGYGLPTAYFLLQGVGVLLERSHFGKQFGFGQGIRGWLYMALVVAGPVFWLFHPPFVMRVIIPFMQAIHAL